MSITQHREAYKLNGSFEYPYFFEQYQKALASVWRPQEVTFESDIRDWQAASQDEREIIGGILRGFTQLETHVSDYWSRVPDWFPKHEVAAAARMFSLSEVVHSEAYNLLSDTLGLDEFEAFLGDPVARQKIGYFLNQKGIKESLAIFSGGAEGVSLFSSFSVLLSFNLESKYKGLAQIISWSINDEQQHSDTGIALLNEYVKENPWTQDEISTVVEGFDAIISNELAFLKSIFKGRKANKIDPEDVEHFIYYRANNRLSKMGISKRYVYDKVKADNIKQWFEPLAAGITSTDFFAAAKDGALYISKPVQDFASVNLKALDLIIS